MMRPDAGGGVAALLVAVMAAPLAASDPADFGETFSTGVARGHDPLRGQVQLRLAWKLEPAPALISIILDDLGEQHDAGLRAVALPGAVACSFLPFGRFTSQHAELVHASGKEVLVHLPMEPLNTAHRHPTSLMASDDRELMNGYLRSAIAAVPHARGLNNHQGSLMTEHPVLMSWLMDEIKAQHPGMYFVDSRTSRFSVAFRAALRRAVPAAERNYFLDNVRGEAYVRASFRDLVARAQRDGSALAIGHPYPETFRVLEEELPRLGAQRVSLVPPSTLIARRRGTGAATPTSLTKAAKPATSTAGPGLPGSMSAAAR